MNNTYIDTRKITVEYAKTHTEDKQLLINKERFSKNKKTNKKLKVEKDSKYGEFADFMGEMDMGSKTVESKSQFPKFRNLTF